MGARVLQFAPISKPITQIVKPKNAWDQFDPSGHITKEWEDFFRYTQAILNTVPQVIGSVELADQAAAISATAIATIFPTLPNERLLPGLYRVSYYVRVTRAATVSSDVTVSIRWVDESVTITQAGATLNGNTTSTYETNSFLVRVDSESSISYLTAYNSSGATTMQYDLDIWLEALPEAA